MEFLREYKEKLTGYVANDQLYTVLILAVVAIAAFGLGRWSVVPEEVSSRPVLVPTSVAVEADREVVVAEVATAATTTGSFVASVNGTKYHALNCPGAKQISEQNKLYFQTTAEARAAGYTPAANCSF